MKNITQNYKNSISRFGRELDSLITYTIDNQEIVLTSEELNQVTPSFKSDILKSAMKQLKIDSNVEIPIGTVINYQFGVKVSNNEVQDFRDNYEYINYGDYIVYSVEKKEDTDSYDILCYDYMLNSMKEYESFAVYPISIRNYIRDLCTKIGLTFKNQNETFVNWNRVIENELYLDTEGKSLGYTYRDVLDELAEVTASTICINEEDNQLEIRYINNTNDEIDEEFFKDINVNFGQKFGVVNAVVLSRADESDSIYRRDEESIEENGLCEIKIKDNQIMNFNDRDEYIDGIYNQLLGLEYYINDYSSPGITYYEICDRYNVRIKDKFYSCVMFNDETIVTQGLEENVNTPLPETNETDYKYASKTDRTINQAYIIAKKNESEIEALTKKIVDISKTVSGRGSIQLENAHEGYLHRLELKPTQYLSALFPSEDLEPSENLIPFDFVLIVDNEKYILDIDYLNYIDSEHYDKFICEDGKCWIEKINGTIEEREDLLIHVNSDSIISMEGTDKVIISATYLLENEYTNNFANQVDVEAQFLMQENRIEETVKAVADDNGVITSGSIILAINKDESLAEINADKINLNGLVTANGNFRVLLDGSIEAKNARFTGIVSGGKISVADVYTNNNPYLEIYDINAEEEKPITTKIWSNGILCKDYSGNNPLIRTEKDGTYAEMNGSVVNAYGFNNVSLESEKKDFEKLENALDIIKDIDVYKFRYKEENETKKHIGLVIGENYKYSKDVTTNNNEEVDLYSFISVCCKAIKELQEEIIELKEKIK